MGLDHALRFVLSVPMIGMTRLTQCQTLSTRAKIAKTTSRLASSPPPSCSATLFVPLPSAVLCCLWLPSPTRVSTTSRLHTSSTSLLVVPLFTSSGNTSLSTSTPPIAAAVSNQPLQPLDNFIDMFPCSELHSQWPHGLGYLGWSHGRLPCQD